MCFRTQRVSRRPSSMRPLLIVAILMIIGTLIIGYAVSMASDLIAEPLFRSWPAWVWMKYRFIIGIAVIIWPRVQVVPHQGVRGMVVEGADAGSWVRHRWAHHERTHYATSCRSHRCWALEFDYAAAFSHKCHGAAGTHAQTPERSRSSQGLV